ncbi:hypothetical protein C5B90_12225 [Haloferax sp. Atlit-12N]|nr:hypothetical protein C5B90_12225 [Haloferax sp. Atlit-12N]
MMVGSLIGRSLGLVAETLLARELGPEVYGSVALAYTIVSTSGNILLLGVHDGVTRFSSTASRKSSRWEMVLAGSITAATAGSIGMLLIWFFSGSLTQIMSLPDLNRSLILISPYLVVFPLSKVTIGILRAGEQSLATVLSRSIAARVGGLAILGGFVHLGVSEKTAIVYWISIPSIIVAFGWFFIHRSGFLSKDSFSVPSKSEFIRLLGFSWPLALSSIIFLFLSQLDVLMIGYFLDAGNVGNYRAIQPLRQATTVVLSSFGFLFLPLATRAFEQGNQTELDQLFTTITKWSVILTLPVVLVFVFESDRIVNFLFGPAYESAALPLAILCGGLFVRSLTGPNGDMVQAIKNTRIEFVSGIGGVVANFTLNLIFIPAYGIAGAALATVAGYTVYNVIELYLIYERVGVTPFSSNIVKPILLSTVLTYFIHNQINLSKPIISIITMAAMTTLLVLSSVILTNSIEDTDMVLLDKFEKKVGRDLRFTRKVLEYGR